MESDNEERRITGQEADNLLKSAVFGLAIKNLMASVLKDLLVAHPGTPEAVELHALLRGIPRIEDELRSLVNDGQMAKRGR